MNKRLVYTAIYGDYDNLGSFKRLDGVDYIAFTDQEINDPYWQVRRGFVSDDPRMAAKKHKLLPVGKYEETLWVDGNVDVQIEDWDAFVNSIEGNKDVAFFKHPNRDCLYREAEVCKQANADWVEDLDEQVERYRENGMPENYGLWAGGIIYRRNTQAVNAIMRAWLYQIENGSVRDQVSLPYVLWRLNYKPGIIPGNLWDNKLFKIRGHK